MDPTDMNVHSPEPHRPETGMAQFLVRQLEATWGQLEEVVPTIVAKRQDFQAVLVEATAAAAAGAKKPGLIMLGGGPHGARYSIGPGDGGSQMRGSGRTLGNKRPAEAPIEIILLRQAELEAMSAQGVADANETILKGGLLGGVGHVAVACHVIAGSFCLLFTLWNGKRLVDDPSKVEGTSPGAMLAACGGGIAFWLRAYFLHYEYWHWSFVALYGGVFLVSLGGILYSLGLGLWDREDLVAKFNEDGGMDFGPWVIYIKAFITFIWGVGMLRLAVGVLFMKLTDVNYYFAFTWLVFSVGSFYELFIQLGRERWVEVPWWTAIALFTMGCFVYALSLRRRKLILAEKHVAEDKQAYDATWGKLMENENNSNCVDEIRKLTDRMKQKPDVKLAREVYKYMQRYMVKSKPRQAVSSLTVLFAQAAALNEHYQDVVADWAQEVGVHSHQCTVKRRSRAIEKLYRSYEREPNRLTDLVRSGITFPDLASLSKCLANILADERVVVLQVKNRFDKEYNSADSAGYRNVSLSMVLVDEFTMCNNLDIHICELQLGVEDFDSKKTDQGHKNYVEYRNARAE